jgi:ribosomal protein S18 acetylase RimI-like enzyme
VPTSDSLVERIAVGFADAERLRRSEAPGAAIMDLDGLRLLFAGVPEPALNSVLVVHEPGDVGAAFDRTEAEFTRRGLQLGIDLAVGRHPSVDAEVRSRGMTLIIKRLGMAVGVDAVARPPSPEGITIDVVTSKEEMLQAAEAAGEAFGDPGRIIRGFYAHSVPAVPQAKCLVARDADGRIVASAAAYLHEGAVGILGLGVRPEFQRKGIGAALTSVAARGFPDADMAWLHPTEAAVKMYRSLGFEEAGDWEVWVARG